MNCRREGGICINDSELTFQGFGMKGLAGSKSAIKVLDNKDLEIIFQYEFDGTAAGYEKTLVDDTLIYRLTK